jgi:hypothetical protein
MWRDFLQLTAHELGAVATLAETRRASAGAVFGHFLCL